MNKLLTAAAVLLALSHPAFADEYVNDFNCTLNKGYTVQQLYAFQQSWMTAAEAHEFGKKIYKTRLYFPAYAEDTRTDPMAFIWRGTFADSMVLGRMLDWFPTSAWADKFNQVMNCGNATLWVAPK